jgi:hypothetical protein
MNARRKKDEKHAGGRPRKFHEESRPVTVTLPERTLRLLAGVDKDRARAIAKAADALVTRAWPDRKRVELVKVDADTALIIVGPSSSLKKIPWLRLIEIAPTRYLLSIPVGTATEKLELAIGDLVEDLPEHAEDERRLLDELRKQISHLRRQNRMSKSEIILVDV